MSHWGATILDAEGLRLTAEEKTLFKQTDPFGFILFARNINSPDQVRALCDEMRQCVGRDAVITIDQEGGRVQRLRSPNWREWPAPLRQVEQTGAAAERAMFLRYRLIAAELADLGIDSNCAPMVDVARPETHGFLRDRCYGTAADQVARLGRAAAEGMLEGGVLPVLKHIPGHGRARVDSHHDLPVVDAALQDLWDSDFLPFHALRDLPMGMTAHLVYSAIDPAPATTSAAMMQIIRNDIGFDNLIMSDDISMKALRGRLGDLSRAAIDAGCDVVLHCNGTLAERREVAEAAGRLDEAGQTRAERAIAMRQPATQVDTAALIAEYEALMEAGDG